MPEVGTAGLFPGATAVSRLRVYDWPTVDGLRGGSPHLHTASAEGYVVLGGAGTLQTLSGDGYAEHPLAEGTVLWFTPGTVHRLVLTGESLDILVVMQNAGLPEAGDAVLTFPMEILADPERYADHAALPAVADQARIAEAARRRRDLAVEGYLALRERVGAEGPAALDEVHRAAAAIVAPKAAGWEALWRTRALAQVEAAGRQIAELAEGRAAHLGASGVHTADPLPGRYGMCGRLGVWDLTGRWA